ncbi:hypothetical protein L4X63_07180 [Geomonas sp. Red32]|uniref:hypothetical protein n=1 Tax=Geomonas sp. Red32 TaxID=2912856 RepID=UPI00202CD7F2|nr:hypothetical protein [Geomonas sp. Red32]MCM0081369.1 hypothetical protein [Geomonas sp. Red32]
MAADLVVQSGAPVYWCHPSTKSHCADNEWFKPLVKRRLSQRNQPFGNLAAGTCQGYHSDGAEFCRCPKCASYIKELSALSKVTTLRDSLASTVFDSLGLSAPVIACSSIFAVDEYGLAPGGDDYVVVNFMGLGGHYDFREGIDPNRWRGEFASFYQQLVRQEKVIFCCHDEKEVGEAKGIDPGAEIFYPGGDFLAAMKFYAGAKYGIFNRVHGAFMLASFGKPAVVIGNDSRARMAAEIGLPHFFMGDVDAELLCDRWRWLAAGGDGYRERFAEIKRRSLDDYLAALASL